MSTPNTGSHACGWVDTQSMTSASVASARMPVISVRGTITCSAVRSPKPKTRCSISPSSSSRTPAFWLAVTSIFSSSSEWTSERALWGSSPTTWTTRAAAALSTEMNGHSTSMKTRVGAETNSAVRSA